MAAKSSKRGHPDKILFKDMTHFEDHHRKMLMKHLRDLLIKLDRDEASVEEVIATFKGWLTSTVGLKKYYTKE